MYSKQEASKIKQDFWTRFGQYMKPIQTAGGEKINWSNYKTGIANIYFRLRAEKTHTSLSIELTNSSEEIRIEQFEQFRSMQIVLEAIMQSPMQWEKNAVDENGKYISTISLTISGVNIFKESDWPAMISFLKTYMIRLDEFWEDGKMVFD